MINEQNSSCKYNQKQQEFRFNIKTTQQKQLQCNEIETKQKIHQPMKQQQFIQEQVKNIFKVSKQLYSTFRGIKKLTMKYLIKIIKLKSKKKLSDEQKQLLQKKQDLQKKKKIKIQSKKNQQQISNQLNQQQLNKNNNTNQSIINILKDNPIKLKSNRPKQQNEQNQQKQPNQKKNKQIPPPDKSKQKPSQKKKSQKPIKTTTTSKPTQQPIKTTKILQKPIQPQSPYYRFLRMKKNEIRSSMNNIPMQKTSQIMKSIWDKMKDQQKKQYVQSYQFDKAKYQRDSAAYFNQQNLKNTGKIDQKENNIQNQSFPDFDFIDQLDKM